MHLLGHFHEGRVVGNCLGHASDVGVLQGGTGHRRRLVGAVGGAASGGNSVRPAPEGGVIRAHLEKLLHHIHVCAAGEEQQGVKARLRCIAWRVWQGRAHEFAAAVAHSSQACQALQPSQAYPSRGSQGASHSRRLRLQTCFSGAAICRVCGPARLRNHEIDEFLIEMQNHIPTSVGFRLSLFFPSGL